MNKPLADHRTQKQPRCVCWPCHLVAQPVHPFSSDHSNVIVNRSRVKHPVRTLRSAFRYEAAPQSLKL